MAQGGERPSVEGPGWPADQVRAQIAATDRQLRRVRRRARSARVQVGQVARLLEVGSARVAVGVAVAARLERAAGGLWQEPVGRVGGPGEGGRGESGWSARSVAVRADAARARARMVVVRQRLAVLVAVGGGGPPPR